MTPEITPITHRGVTLYVELEHDDADPWWEWPWKYTITDSRSEWAPMLQFHICFTRRGALRQARRACRRIARRRLANASGVEHFTYEAWIEPQPEGDA